MKYTVPTQKGQDAQFVEWVASQVNPKYLHWILSNPVRKQWEAKWRRELRLRELASLPAEELLQKIYEELSTAYESYCSDMECYEANAILIEAVEEILEILKRR